MIPLTLNDAIELVLGLPAPVVLTDEAGAVVAASGPARNVLGEDIAGRRLSDIDHREIHRPTPIVCDERPMTIIGVASADTGPFTTERAAHDFNNLLGVIINFSTLASVGLPAGSPAAEDLREVLGAARRAASLAHQLMYAEHGTSV